MDFVENVKFKLVQGSGSMEIQNGDDFFLNEFIIFHLMIFND